MLKAIVVGEQSHVRVSREVVIQVTSPSHDLYHFGTLAAASTPTGSCQNLLLLQWKNSILSSDCLCSALEYLPHNSPVHLFQLRAHEQGMRARLNQTHDDLCTLRRERDDTLRGLDANKGQTRV
jgi:hypothetical protein